MHKVQKVCVQFEQSNASEANAYLKVIISEALLFLLLSFLPTSQDSCSIHQPQSVQVVEILQQLLESHLASH